MLMFFQSIHFVGDKKPASLGRGTKTYPKDNELKEFLERKHTNMRREYGALDAFYNNVLTRSDKFE